MGSGRSSISNHFGARDSSEKQVRVSLGGAVRSEALLTMAHRSEIVEKLRELAPQWPPNEPVEIHTPREGDEQDLRDYFASLFADAGYIVQTKTSILARETSGVVVYGTRPNSLKRATAVAELLALAGFRVQQDRYSEPTDASLIITISG
jgi:hypothetical protein